MGNIRSICCPKDNTSEVVDEREEQSRIWSENGNNYQQYGACSPPTAPCIYKIILPKLTLVDIAPIDPNNHHLYNSVGSSNSYSSTSLPAPPSTPTRPKSPLITTKDPIQNNVDDCEYQTEPVDGNSVTRSITQKLPAVIKEEYCAEEFEHLRSFIFRCPEAQQEFRELLWSCIPWSAPGGKSGSTFMKTINDQFILKQMSKLELQSFLSISEAYFKYVETSYHDDQPSLLSTILGIYRIVYTNTTTQSSSEYYFMVMKNLFHKRVISQRFDLKGSMRNRLVETDDPNDTEHVLMDENLLRITCEHPLFIHAKSKKMLNEAIARDSRFLTSISVMDYSLLVGVDKENKELVLGIIDYVRPFTWDKKIERVVKSVVSTELPTIIEPELYRERFCEAMDKYFESVPDDW